MTKTLKMRVDEDLRREADVVLREMGLDVPSAIRIFLTKVVHTRSIPFDLLASVRVTEVDVDTTTQSKMDEVGSLWREERSRRA